MAKFYPYDYITANRPFIIQELCKEVPEYLLETNVLTVRDYEEIISYEKCEDRTTRLLEVILTKPDEKQCVFLIYVQIWYPWITDHAKETNKRQKTEVAMRTALDEGEVPPLPYRHVVRAEDSLNLLDLLNSIERHDTVVLHGMRGCGKSMLAVHVLNEYPSLVIDKLREMVFWLTIGGEKSDFVAQVELCARMTPSLALQPVPDDPTKAKRFLSDRFNRSEYMKALLILDDVRKLSTLEAFDVGCKILVTTDDVSIMHGYKKRYIPLKISEGFKESETLKLFSESVEVDEKNLPSQAKTIHDLCRGFPFAISVISSQFSDHREFMQHDNELWKDYTLNLRKGGVEAAIGRYDRCRSKQVAMFYRVLSLRINDLDQELRDLYLELALFMEDVNIRPEVLCMLWSKPKKEVIDTMLAFEKRNLVHKMWSPAKRSYIYFVHNLLTGYLKKQMNDSDKKNLHRRFIKSYQEQYGKAFHDFPVDDNYILSYLGYHLIEADMTDEFPNIYLNLKFIEKKVVHCRVHELFLDLKKYKNYIAHDEASTKKYEDIACFIRRVAASCRPVSNCNIVQFGLCERKDSDVYKAAVELKHQEDPSYLVNNYFELITPDPVENSSPAVLSDRIGVISAAFIPCGDILVANPKGDIRRVHVGDDQLWSTLTFEGHTEPVTELQVKHQIFVSASVDKTVRVWNLNGTIDDSNCFENRRTPSPEVRQPNYEAGYLKSLRSTGEKAMFVIPHEAPVKFVRFCNNPAAFDIVTVDALNRIRTIFAVVIVDSRPLKYPDRPPIQTEGPDIQSCSFSNDDSMVLYICSTGELFVRKSWSGELIKRLNLLTNDIRSMIIVPGSFFTENTKDNPDAQVITAVIFGNMDFNVVKFNPNDDSEMSEIVPGRRYGSSYGRKRKDEYVCGALSFDNNYVAIATSDNNLFIYDTTSGEEVLKFNESNGKIKSIRWSVKNDALLTTYENSKLLKVWNVHEDGSIKLRKNVFDAAWISSNGEEKCVAAALHCGNFLNIFFGLHLEKELNLGDERITHVCVCPSNGDIVYAQEDGTVNLVDVADWQKRNIIACDHHRVLTVQAFGAKSLTLVILLVEDVETKGVFSLLGWRRTVNEDSTVDSEISIDYQPLPRYAVLDFAADLKNDKLYVMTVDQAFHVYDLSSGNLLREEDLNAYSLDTVLTNMMCCDISSDFEYIVTGSEKRHFLRRTTGTESPGALLTSEELCSNTVVRTYKFSWDAKYLVVGFESSDIEIYEVASVCAIKVDKPFELSPGSVLDVIWSPSNDRFIVIFEREITLYRIIDNEAKPYAIHYMSVDKLVSDAAFNRSATVDSGGHFRVIEHPF